MIKAVDSVLEGENLLVYCITVEIGDLSGVVPRFLADCWEAVAAGTRYARTDQAAPLYPDDSPMSPMRGLREHFCGGCGKAACNLHSAPKQKPCTERQRKY